MKFIILYSTPECLEIFNYALLGTVGGSPVRTFKWVNKQAINRLF